MMLAGIPVLDQDVVDLARRLRADGFVDTAETIELAYAMERRLVALTVPDREAILRTLEECPVGLVELRGVFVREHAWRMENGL